MLDTMRTLLLAAVGAIDLTEDKLRSITDELVRRGELAADEARQIAARLSAQSAESANADEGLRRVIEDTLGRCNVASQETVTALEIRLAALEQAIDRLATPRSSS